MLCSLKLNWKLIKSVGRLGQIKFAALDYHLPFCCHGTLATRIRLIDQARRHSSSVPRRSCWRCCCPSSSSPWVALDWGLCAPDWQTHPAPRGHFAQDCGGHHRRAGNRPPVALNSYHWRNNPIWSYCMNCRSGDLCPSPLACDTSADCSSGATTTTKTRKLQVRSTSGSFLSRGAKKTHHSLTDNCSSPGQLPGP